MSEFCDKKCSKQNIKNLLPKLNLAKHPYLSFVHLESWVKQMQNEVFFQKFTNIDIIIVKACLTIQMEDVSNNFYDKKTKLTKISK